MSKRPTRHRRRTAPSLHREHIILYRNDSVACEEAELLLRKTCLQLKIVRTGVDSHGVLPTAIYRAWRYPGLEKIKVIPLQVARERAPLPYGPAHVTAEQIGSAVDRLAMQKEGR